MCQLPPSAGSSSCCIEQARGQLSPQVDKGMSLKEPSCPDLSINTEASVAL